MVGKGQNVNKLNKLKFLVIKSECGPWEHTVSPVRARLTLWEGPREERRPKGMVANPPGGTRSCNIFHFKVQ